MNVSAIFPLPLNAACFVSGTSGFRGLKSGSVGLFGRMSEPFRAPWQLNSWVHRENARGHHRLTVGTLPGSDVFDKGSSVGSLSSDPPGVFGVLVKDQPLSCFLRESWQRSLNSQISTLAPGFTLVRRVVPREFDSGQTEPRSPSTRGKGGE